jgi:hypothetical protein
MPARELASPPIDSRLPAADTVLGDSDIRDLLLHHDRSQFAVLTVLITVAVKDGHQAKALMRITGCQPERYNEALAKLSASTPDGTYLWHRDRRQQTVYWFGGVS